jgi:hypothetical protein
MKATILVFLTLFFSGNLLAQTDWTKVDFAKKYKGTFKIGGASAKSLKNNKTFINSYTISQATTMKGSEKSATKAVFSEVSLGGLDNESYQQMVNELYKNLVEELKTAGLKVTEGEDVMATGFVKDKISNNKKDEYVGPVGENTMYEGKKKITDGSMPGYRVWAVLNDVSFIPQGKIIYTTSSIIKSGNFYGKLAAKENVNLLSIAYNVTFASFDGGRGYKDIKLSTNPVLAVSVTVGLGTPNGAFNKIYYDKLPVWGSADWSEGIVKGKDNKSTSEFLGLARSAEYEITANSAKYLSEAKTIIENLQKDIVKGIKAAL